MLQPQQVAGPVAVQVQLTDVILNVMIVVMIVAIFSYIIKKVREP